MDAKEPWMFQSKISMQLFAFGVNKVFARFCGSEPIWSKTSHPVSPWDFFVLMLF